MHESREDAAGLVAIARSELIVGGQKSGKSRRAAMLAQGWRARSASHGALATRPPTADNGSAQAALKAAGLPLMLENIA
jgi:hypothetical protein